MYIRLSISGALAWVMLGVGAHAASLLSDADVFQARDKKMGTLRQGASVTVLQESGEWMKVRYETMDAAFEGYVRRELINTNEAGPTVDSPFEESPVTTVGTAASMTGATTAVVSATQPATTNDVAPKTALQGASKNTVELGLSSHWQIQSKSGGILAADFVRLLSDVAKPRINLTAQQNYVLYRDLYYLMPIEAALRQFNQTKVAPVAVTTPGMPSGSFKSYSFDITDDKRFRHLTMVGDTKNQLVAVQLSDSGQKEPMLLSRFEDAENKIMYSEDMKLFDVVNGGTKGSSNWRVGAIMHAGTNGVVSIQTELVSGSIRDDLKSRERVRLLIPQPVADLCAWLLQNRK